MTGYLTSGGVAEGEAISVLLKSIPLNFYCILAVFGTLAVCLFNINIGPMRKAEERAEKTGELDEPGHGGALSDAADKGSDAKPRVINMVLPMCVLIVTILATLTVTGAEDVLWTSSDTNVATVDANGLVTAGIPGTATITVTTADGSQSAACTVNVATPLPEPPKEKLGLRSIYQDKGETINEFSAKVGSTVQMRVDGTEQTVTWTIEDTKIATVDANGLVTAVAKGKTILKATVGDQSVSCFVIVN